MEILKNAAIIFIALMGIIIFFISLFSKKMIKTLLINAVCGIAILFILSLTSRFTGVILPINEWSFCSGAIFGVPAVIGMLVFNTFL